MPTCGLSGFGEESACPAGTQRRDEGHQCWSSEARSSGACSQSDCCASTCWEEGWRDSGDASGSYQCPATAEARSSRDHHDCGEQCAQSSECCVPRCSLSAFANQSMCAAGATFKGEWTECESSEARSSGACTESDCCRQTCSGAGYTDGGAASCPASMLYRTEDWFECKTGGCSDAECCGAPSSGGGTCWDAGFRDSSAAAVNGTVLCPAGQMARSQEDGHTCGGEACFASECCHAQSSPPPSPPPLPPPSPPPSLPPPLSPLTLTERYGHNLSWCVTPRPLVSTSLVSPAADVPAGYVRTPESGDQSLDGGTCVRLSAVETLTHNNLSTSHAYSLFPGALAPGIMWRASKYHPYSSVGTPLALQLILTLTLALTLNPNPNPNPDPDPDTDPNQARPSHSSYRCRVQIRAARPLPTPLPRGLRCRAVATHAMSCVRVAARARYGFPGSSPSRWSSSCADDHTYPCYSSLVTRV